MNGYEPNWDIDLAFGEQGELLVADMLEQLRDGHAAIEVKRERWENDRLYVEVMQRPAWRGSEDDYPWKDSGLRTTKADYWVFLKPHGLALWIPPSRLRIVIDTADPRKSSCAGENPTRGYLVDIATLFERGQS